MGLPISFLEAILHPQQDEEIDIVAEMEKESSEYENKKANKVRGKIAAGSTVSSKKTNKTELSTK